MASGKKLSPADAKAKVLNLIRAGSGVKEAMSSVERTVETYRTWRANDFDFRREIDYIRESNSKEREGDREPVPDFPEFCEQYLHQPLGEHHLRIWDVLNGRPPRNMHPAMEFRQGWPERVIINIPPEHAKSTTWTMNYVVWRIHRDPNIRVVIVSETLNMAKKYLKSIKNKLTSSVYREMHLKFAPEGGWRDPDNSWSATQIYVGGKCDGEKDPTVEALGSKGQIQGARADLIILDDIQTLKTLARTEDLADWISQDVLSRLPAEEQGMLLDIGTRVKTNDIHRLLRDDYTDYEGNHVFTWFKQPAVLEQADDPNDWVTLWPKHKNGRPAWPGRALAKRRSELRNDAMWALVYQQQDVADNATFPPAAIEASVNPFRHAGRGPLDAEDAAGKFYVIGSVDPAAVNFTAIIIYAVDRRTKRRQVLDGLNKRDLRSDDLQIAMKSFTERYGVREWRVETNAYQKSIVQQREFVRWMFSHGAIVRPHLTGNNKYDPDFGVGAMAPLFLSCIEETDGGHRRIPGLIELPSKKTNAVIGQLCDQLVAWAPKQKNLVQDLVMALWFAELGATEWLASFGSGHSSHMRTPFTTRRDERLQRVVDLSTLHEEARHA